MNLTELFLGQIPEAIYFALFLIFTKELKTKRILFVILMILEYLLLIYTFKYNWIFHIGFMITTFLTLKVLYKDMSQITDVFLLLISYIIMIISSGVCFLIFAPNVALAAIINRILLFIFVILFKNKLHAIQNIYKKLWNRSTNNSNKMKSTTFRSLNVVVFNIIYFIINAGMVYALFLLNR